MPDIPARHLGHAKSMARDLAALIVRENRKRVQPLTPLEIVTSAEHSGDSVWRRLARAVQREHVPGNVTRAWAADVAAAHTQADAALDILQQALASASSNLTEAEDIADHRARANRMEAIAGHLLDAVGRAAESLHVQDPVGQPLRRSA